MWYTATLGLEFSVRREARGSEALGAVMVAQGTRLGSNAFSSAAPLNPNLRELPIALYLNHATVT